MNPIKDEARWFLSFRVLGQLSSYVLLLNVSADMSSSLLQVFVELGRKNLNM